MFIYQKTVDRSTLRQGFQIPVEFHDLLRAMPGGMPQHGESREIKLLIDGQEFTEFTTASNTKYMAYDKDSHKEIAIASNALVVDIKAIIEQGKRQAYSAINVTVIDMYWKIGQRIVEEEQKGEYRAEYGKALIDNLSDKLSFDYGEGFSARYLRAFRQFYKIIPDYRFGNRGFQILHGHISTVH